MLGRAPSRGEVGMWGSQSPAFPEPSGGGTLFSAFCTHRLLGERLLLLFHRGRKAEVAEEAAGRRRGRDLNPSSQAPGAAP